MNKKKMCPVCGKSYIEKIDITSPFGYKSVTYVHTLEPYGKNAAFEITMKKGCYVNLETGEKTMRDDRE